MPTDPSMYHESKQYRNHNAHGYPLHIQSVEIEMIYA